MPRRFSRTTYGASAGHLGEKWGEKNGTTDLLGEIVDLRDERALLEVHFSTVSLEIVDRALVQLCLRSAYPFETTDVFA